MPIPTFRDLIVWQRAMVLAENVYKLTASFPTEERFGLTAQLRRTVVSIPSNIAEGKGRQKTGPYVNHLKIALGSEAELQTQLELAYRLGFTERKRVAPLLDAASEVGRMLNGLVASLAPADADDEPAPDSLIP